MEIEIKSFQADILRVLPSLKVKIQMSPLVSPAGLVLFMSDQLHDEGSLRGWCESASRHLLPSCLTLLSQPPFDQLNNKWAAGDSRVESQCDLMLQLQRVQPYERPNTDQPVFIFLLLMLSRESFLYHGCPLLLLLLLLLLLWCFTAVGIRHIALLPLAEELNIRRNFNDYRRYNLLILEWL